MDVAFRCGAQPGETQMRAISSVREVYGIRRIAFNEKERTLRVEYDASHLMSGSNWNTTRVPLKLPFSRSSCGIPNTESRHSTCSESILTTIGRSS